MKIAKQEIIPILMGLVFVSFCGYVLIMDSIREYSLKKKLEYSYAIATGDFFSIRYTDFFRYRFCINGKFYVGRGK